VKVSLHKREGRNKERLEILDPTIHLRLHSRLYLRIKSDKPLQGLRMFLLSKSPKKCFSLISLETIQFQGNKLQEMVKKTSQTMNKAIHNRKSSKSNYTHSSNSSNKTATRSMLRINLKDHFLLSFARIEQTSKCIKF